MSVRLIVHMGFHKTASTHLQDLMNRNSDHLAERGIWYERQPGYPAHHAAAHALMRGDSEPFEAMCANALAAGCHTLILSSEDLECALFNPEVCELIETVAASFGIAPIEWHCIIREPGSYFESLYAQLSWHTFADPLQMFSEVMKKGVLFLPEPFVGEHATPYWFYCFDYKLFFAEFAAYGRDLYVYDYADRHPYPGWQILDRLSALDAMIEPAGQDAANARLIPAVVSEHFMARIDNLIDDHVGWAAIRSAVLDHIDSGQSISAALARLVGSRYADSYRGALQQFQRRAAR